MEQDRAFESSRICRDRTTAMDWNAMSTSIPAKAMLQISFYSHSLLVTAKYWW